MKKTNRFFLGCASTLVSAAFALALAPTCLGGAADATSITPTDKAPFKVPADAAEKKALVDAIKQYMELPPDQVKAHPAAADFPGVVPADAARVARDIAITFPPPDTGAGRHGGWQSTGLYADAGQIVTVKLASPLLDGVTLSVRIGCHTDKLFSDKITEWKRFPTLSREFPLTSPSTQIASAFGGPLFVSMKSSRKPPTAEVKASLHFANAVEAPFFVLGKTTREQWKKLRTAPAPWGELVGKNMILHFPAKQVREMDDPTALLEWWDNVVAKEDSLAGWPARTVQERVVPDRQISAGYMHSGYPFMCHLVSAPDITNLPKLKTSGDWGFFHELGHNHQSKDWTFQKPFSQTEVTVNFFSLYCMEQICGKRRGSGHGALEGAKFLAALDKRFAEPPSADPFDQLAPFIVLLHKYGWDPLKQTLTSYQSQPNAPKMSEEERQTEFVRRYSKNAKANLSAYFQKLGYAVPAELAAELKALPAFDYEAWRKEWTASHPALPKKR